MSNLMELGKLDLINTRRGSLKKMVRDAAKLLDRFRLKENAKAQTAQTIQETDSDGDESEAEDSD